MSAPLFMPITGGFSQVLAGLDQSELQLTEYSSADVTRALQQSSIGLSELMALLSPAATALLPELLIRASQLTRQHFWRGPPVICATLYVKFMRQRMYLLWLLHESGGQTPGAHLQ